MFRTTMWPLLGFLFMPWTTLAYMYAMNVNGAISDGYIVLVIVAALTDLSGSSTTLRRRE